MKLIKYIVWKFLNTFKLGGIVELVLKVSYLNKKGWFKSYNLKQSKDLSKVFSLKFLYTIS